MPGALLAALDDAVDQQHQARDGAQHADAGRSCPGPGSSTRATRHRPRPAPTAVNGTLIRKTEPHQKCASSSAADDRADRDADADRARPRCRWRAAARPGRRRCVMMDSVAASRPRPPKPISARAPRSADPGVCAYAAVTSETTPNATRPDHAASACGRVRSPSTPEREQQPGEHQGVGVDRPLQLALAGAEARHRARRSSCSATFSTVLSSTDRHRLVIRTPRMSQRRR